MRLTGKYAYVPSVDIRCFELAHIVNLTVELTRLRIEQCNHLLIENYGPGLFKDLLWSFKEGVYPRPVNKVSSFYDLKLGVPFEEKKDG